MFETIKANCDIIITDSFISFPQCLDDHGFFSDRKFLIVTDEHVKASAASELEHILITRNCKVICLSLGGSGCGDSVKNQNNAEKIISLLFENRFNRDDVIISVGGGTVSDIAGFCASVYKRGMKLVLVPTTLLAQIDASVGGKTAIDFQENKNIIGSFYDPEFVFTNISALKTLPDHVFFEGMSELIKTALIGDVNLYNKLTEISDAADGKNMPAGCLAELIAACINIKARYVKSDYSDTSGVRAFLNFGHTIGHAIESISGFAVSHGQAVSLGMAAANRISVSKGILHLEDEKKIKALQNKFVLPTRLRDTGISICPDREQVLECIYNDKKQSSAGLKFILLESPGHAIITNKLTDEDILKGIDSIL